MDRKEHLFKILSLRRELTDIYHKYLATPREYYPCEQLHMRQVHMVVEIGLAGLDNIGELSERLKITPGAVSQYLAKLEKRGFIIRVQDIQDKRQFSVRLTPKGEELYHRHVKFDQGAYSKACSLFREFTEEELDAVYRFDKRFKEFIKQGEEMFLEDGIKDR